MPFKNFDLEIQDDVNSVPEQFNGTVTTAGTPEIVTATGNKKIYAAIITNQKKGINGNNGNDVLYISVNSETDVLTIERSGNLTISGLIDQIKVDSNNNGVKFEIYMIRAK